MAGLLQDRIRRLSTRLGFERDWYLVIVAAGIGILMGLVATAFIYPLRWIEEWAENPGTDKTLLMTLIVGGPMVGALIAGVVIHLIGDASHMPGVSAVMYSVHRLKSRLPLRMAVRKWLASTATIGSGGSAGAEGPIVTIGATIGSNLGQWLQTSPQNTATLLGCGAAAGLASVFNAPIAGAFFVLEILLRDFSLRTFTPILIASVISATWTQTMLQNAEPLFPVTEQFFPATEYFKIYEVPNFFMLGIVCGVLAPLFVRMLIFTTSLFNRVKLHPIVKPAIGGALLGLIGLCYLLTKPTDHILPPFFGNGYPIIADFLDPSTYFTDTENRMLKPVLGLLTLLCGVGLAKAVATSLTIGSGGAGGLFAPSLLMGAGIGGGFGVIVYELNWFPASSPALYALVGMAAMLAGTVHAPLTGIIIVYEMTRSEQVILPLMLAAVIGTIVSRIISRDSVYTGVLTARGLRVGAMSDLTILRRLSVSDVPLNEAVFVHPTESAQRLLDLAEAHQAEDFVVSDADNRYVGMVVGGDLRTALVQREALPLLLVNELQREDLPTVTPDDMLDVVLDRFALHDVHSLAVLDPKSDGHVLGVITRDRLMRRYQQALAED